MIISFDLDDTLIPGTKSFPIERRNFFQKSLGIEPIRLGTKDLFKALKAQGHALCIYTTSFRSPFFIRLTFLTYGIFLYRIINQSIHNKVLGARCNEFSKFPPAFNIDLHVDDSPGVQLEGIRHGFKTKIIDEGNTDWVSIVFRSVQQNKS